MSIQSRNPKSPSEWTDRDVEGEIARVRDAIKDWLKARGLWYDCGFKSDLEHRQREPSEYSVVTLFYSDMGLDSITDGEWCSEWEDLFEKLGYHYEQDDNVTLSVYTDEDELNAKYYEYFQWKWVCSLLIEDTGDVYEELYGYFARRPDALHSLHWREFEVLLYRIFQNHGYRAILGPGRADGGIDLRLWQENPLGDVLTVVQAKRYAAHNKIDLQPVAALNGVRDAEEAVNALFVTTSSYTPAARRFADRVSDRLVLVGKEEIISWCSHATNGIVKDKSTLVSRSAVERLIKALSANPDTRIVHATWGYNTCHNAYAIVIKETRHAALLLTIGNREVSNDGYGQRGSEVPLLDGTAMAQFNEMGVKRALRSVREDGSPSYWDGSLYYTPWDKGPNRYDYMD
ncbi:restriction endonuclease [Paraburkholderia fungorum]|uniref:restriction endonuclease n=1 Tax=Paraburkholderia fungorum TaxID=134537 RepID=UPI0038779CA0